MIVNKIYFNVKIYILLLFFISIFSLYYSSNNNLNYFSLFSQVRPKQSKKPISKNKSNKKNINNKKNQQKRNRLNLLKYAKRSENRGDNRSAFQYYNRLMKSNKDTDFEVIEGYIRTSIAIQKIKECQKKLTDILNIYEIKADKSGKKLKIKDFNYYKLLSELAYFYLATNRDQLADQLILKISLTKSIKFEKKTILISNVYEKSGNIDYAIKYLLDARSMIDISKDNTLNDLNRFTFSNQLFKLYHKNLDYKNSSFELLNYLFSNEYDTNPEKKTISNLNIYKNLLKRDNINNSKFNHNNTISNSSKSKNEKKFYDVENGYLKIFESISEDSNGNNVKKEIFDNILKTKRNLSTIIQEISQNISKDSLQIEIIRLEKSINTILFSLNFKEKKYKEAYEYFSLGSNNDIDKIIKFANQLFNEDEFDLSYKYYSEIISKTDFFNSYNELNKSDRNKQNRTYTEIFDNYLATLKSLDKNDDAIIFLEDLFTESKNYKVTFISQDDIFLELAKIYQYDLFNLEKAEEIYIDKFNLKNSFFNKSKNKHRSDVSNLTASINYYELLLLKHDKIKSDKLYNYIKNNNLISRIPSEKERYHFLFIISSILIEKDYNLFFKRTDDFIKNNLNSDYSNDLLSISFKLKSILSFTENGNLKSITSDNLNHLIFSYIKFYLIENYIISNDEFLSYEKFESLNEQIFIIKFKYNYFKSNLMIKELNHLVENILSDELFKVGTVSNIEIKSNNFFDEIFLDYVIFSKENNDLKNYGKKLVKEVLTYFLNNYDNSVLYDDARLLLREI